MTNKNLLTLTYFFFFSAVFYACGTSEDTIEVVEETPSTQEAAEPDTVDEEFTEITIGLIDSVSSFDPLFAENLSTQRTLSLIYEGLYTLDHNGNPIPAIALHVEISEDSLEYVFTLDQNKYYHNSPVFTAGVGRRVTATDVKQALERTANPTVPRHAAELLMGISGFENFYLEQRSVYDPEKRVLNGAGGIQVIDSQTLGIVLEEKDPHFLKKLASPYLFIYPRETVNSDSRHISDHPVGTGPYQINRVENNGSIVLSRTDREDNGQTDNLLINQINLRFLPDESELFQEFTGDRIDWIPEVGPDISDQIINEEENLQSSYEESFNMVTHNAYRITAGYLNENADVNHDWLTGRLAYLTSEDISTRGSLSLNVDDFEIAGDAEPQDRYYASYSDDLIARELLTELHNIIFAPESSLVMFDIRVPTRQTSIYMETSNSMHEELNPLNENYWIRLDTGILGLYKEHLSGIEPTIVPWHLHIKQVRVQNSELATE